MSNIFIKSLKKIPTWKITDVYAQPDYSILEKTPFHTCEKWEEQNRKFTKASIKLTHTDRYKDQNFQIMLSLDEHQAKEILKYLKEALKK